MYSEIRIIPKLCVRRQRLIMSANNKTRTETKRSTIDIPKPSVLVTISESTRYDFINHGRPRPIKISNILDPMPLLTAIPPLPCLATITDDIISGTDVPTASTVSAITTSGTSNI